MAAIISSHNRHVLKCSVNTYDCNSKNRSSCLSDRKCKTPKPVYRVDVSNNFDNENKYYYGLTESLFTERYGNHKSSFKQEMFNNTTELSKFV